MNVPRIPGAGRWIRRYGLKLVALCFLGGGMTACSFGRLTINATLHPADVEFIVPGRTTFHEIVERIGAPDDMAEALGGAVVFYHFRDMQYSRVNFGYLLRPWTPVQPDLVLSTTGLGTDVFEVTFNEQWVAQRHAFTRHPAGRSHVPWPF